MRGVRILLCLLVAAGCLTGCGGDGDLNRVTVYTSLDEELAREIFRAFKDDTGIKVHWVRLSTGECVTRLEVERESPQASLWYGGVGLGHLEAKNRGLTVSYATESGDARFKDNAHHWSGLYAGLLCFESNTQRLARYGLEAPTSWEDLAAPRFKGHVQMAHPGSSGTAYNLLSTLVQLMGEDEAFDYLSRLDANITKYTRSGHAPGRAASIGEVTVAIGYAHDGIRLKKQGYPLAITFPSEGTGYEVASISLIKDGPPRERAAAQRLYDWALGERAAKLYASQYVVPFYDVPLLLEAVPRDEVKTVNQDDAWAAENRQRLLDKWDTLIGGTGSPAR